MAACNSADRARQAKPARSPSNDLSAGTSIFASIPLLPDDSREEWEAHRAGVIQSIEPVGPVEMHFTEYLAVLFWRLARVNRFIATATTQAIDRIDDPPEDHGFEFGAFGNKSETAAQKSDRESRDKRRLRVERSLLDESTMTRVHAEEQHLQERIEQTLCLIREARSLRS